jgi:hypothetical protein
MFITKKRLLIGIIGVGTISTYFYRKHMYEKELFDRMNYLLQNNIKLSGVYLQQRKPFGNCLFLGYFFWSSPYYHLSLKISPDGNPRHVGLGKVSSDFFNLDAEFVLHKGEKYENLNQLESSIPIEAWVKYKRKYGHFPNNINVKVLNEITLTRQEAEAAGMSTDHLYKTTFGQISRDDNGDLVISTCISAVIDVIREEEKRRPRPNELELNE